MSSPPHLSRSQGHVGHQSRDSRRQGPSPWSLGRRVLPLHRHRAHGVSKPRRSLRHASHPAHAHRALRRDAGADGSRFQCEHARHARVRPRRRFFLEQHRPASRHSHQPRSALDPDGAARLRTQPHGICDSAYPTGPVHGLCLHPHPCLSRRALQRTGFGLGLRRLHHRQRCEQPDRTADLGWRRRSFRARRQFLFPARCSSISPWRRPRR